jgi:hypothetical protein
MLCKLQPKVRIVFVRVRARAEASPCFRAIVRPFSMRPCRRGFPNAGWSGVFHIVLCGDGASVKAGYLVEPATHHTLGIWKRQLVRQQRRNNVVKNLQPSLTGLR